MSATKHIPDSGNSGPYYVPPEPKRWPSIGLAVGVHALLLAFLVIGVSWQNNEPVAVEAEVWDVKTETAAPPPPQPAPEPEPQPQPETPPPPPQPVQKAVEPPPPPVEQPVVKQPKAPDIALEKKRKEEAKRKQQQEEADRQERERQEELARQKLAEEKKAKQLAEKKQRDAAEKKEREAAEKKAQAEQARKDAAEQAKKEAAEQKKKDEADKKKKAEAEKKKAAEEAKRMEAARAEEMRRITGAAGNPSSTGTNGNAEKSSAPHRDAGYIAAITAKVKGNSSYSGDDPGNPVVSFRVEQLPTGEIISVRKTKSSGIAAFDDAIERAIKASSPLPKKKDGTVERSLDINFKMKDMQ